MTRPDWTILDRYLAGECSPQEVAAVRKWLVAHPDHQRELDTIRATLDPSERMGAGQGVDRAWTGISTRLTASHAYAGAFPHRRSWPVVAAATLVCAVTIFAWREHFWPTHPVPQRVYSAAAGQRSSVRLADGTAIILAPESHVRVPVDYASGNRTVTLDGEALFTVAHDARHPFSVHARDAVATDIGTQFDVRAYGDDRDVRIGVTEGRVAIDVGAGRAGLGTVCDRPCATRLRRSAPTTAAAGDLATIADTALAITHAADVTAFTAWTRGELRFVKTPLRDALAELGRWYALDIQTPDASLAAQPVTASFANQSADAVLTSLATLFDARWRRTGNVVVFSR